MGSPRSGTRYRALAVVDYVCFDLDRVYVAPNKAKFFLYQESIIIYFCRTRYSGAALCKLTLQVIDFAPRPR
jgi:hypothetical protein